jgi:hypothetical protein
MFIHLRPNCETCSSRTWTTIAKFMLAATILTSTHAHARNEQLSVTQAANQSIMVTLFGSILYCDPQLGGYPYSPSVSTVSVVGFNANIVSRIGVGECPAAPPGFVFPPPIPYSVVANLGVLPDGAYTATWVFVGGAPSPQLFQTTFFLQGGTLLVPGPIPTLSLLSYLILSMLIAASYPMLNRQHRNH